MRKRGTQVNAIVHHVVRGYGFWRFSICNPPVEGGTRQEMAVQPFPRRFSIPPPICWHSLLPPPLVPGKRYLLLIIPVFSSVRWLQGMHVEDIL